MQIKFCFRIILPCLYVLIQSDTNSLFILFSPKYTIFLHKLSIDDFMFLLRYKMQESSIILLSFLQSDSSLCAVANYKQFSVPLTQVFSEVRLQLAIIATIDTCVLLIAIPL